MIVVDPVNGCAVRDRSIRPLDIETVISSVKKTNHLVTVEGGFPGELACHTSPFLVMRLTDCP